MRSYEGVFIFRPEDAHVNEGKTFVKSEMEKAGFTITSETDMGEREFAYAIDGLSKGRYHLFEVDCEPESVSALGDTFRHKHDILKFLFTRK
jgi:ribosomal protein S6